jgi:cytochrome c553
MAAEFQTRRKQLSAAGPSARSIWAAALAAVVTASIVAPALRAESPTPDGAEFFEKKVRPILVEKCQKCHGSQRQKGGLRLDSREAAFKGGESGPVIVAGHPEKSELVRAVNYEADGFQMPPTGKLDAESIAVLANWVRLGAPWPASAASGNRQRTQASFDFAERAKHWSFRPLRTGRPPMAPQASWARNPLDCFLASQLHGSGLDPAPTADRRTLLRRITFDLTGLPPTREEIHVFLADDSSAAYEKVVDRLLASPHYGVRWGRHWLDLVRYAETCGHEFDFDIPAVWPYRDYMVRAFNDDLPYDAYVTEHIAGDSLTSPRRNPRDATNESIIGTAFWWFAQAKQSPVDVRAEQCDTVDNQIDVFGKAFLGLSIACARCHDHKFDPIRAQDYYALAGFLRSSRRQVAFIDDPAPVERFAEWRRAEAARRLQNVAASLAAKPTTSDETVTDPEGILRPWKALGSLPAGRTFTTARLELAKDVNQRDAQCGARQGAAVAFENFAKPDFAGWQISGPAFGSRPSRAGDFVLGIDPDRPIEQLAPAGAAHSGLISPKLRGSIRSKAFTIDKPYIHYRATRQHAAGAEPRQLKAGQLNLIVDGFQVIRDPLYGHLSITVANDAPTAWYTQHVAKLKGERAYIEIVDEDDGWIAVDSIVFSDDPRPPERPPNRLIAALLNDGSLDSGDKLVARYSKLFTETLRLWKAGGLADDPYAGDRVAILDWLCRRRRVPAERPASHELATLLSDGRRREAAFERANRVIAMIDGTAENEHVLVRGNHKKPGPEVPRRFLEVFGGRPIPATATSSGRLQLAREITGSAKPLLARVLVNRLWQHHFGRGLVAPPDDFGKNGQPPTHPALLDYLAAEFIRSGWSIKHMQRLMVLSAAYRMSSRDVNAKSAAADPENRLLHRMPVKRLEAEAIRDSILAVSGRLNERLEGPSIPVYLDEFMTGRGRPTTSGPLDGDGRRSIYLAVRRNFLTPMFLAFDYPATGTTAGRRGTSNVPAQALALLNNPFVVQQADLWAKQLTATGGRIRTATTAAPTIDTLYETAFGRLPTAVEQAAAQEFLGQQAGDPGAADPSAAWSDLCHVLVNVKEFIYVE